MTAASSGTEGELSDQEVLDTHNDLEMLRRPHLWPHGGKVLPLKRGRFDNDQEYAVILFVNKHGIGSHADENVYMLAPNRLLPQLMGLFGKPGELQEELRKGEPPVFGGDFLLRTLVDSGWVVD